VQCRPPDRPQADRPHARRPTGPTAGSVTYDDDRRQQNNIGPSGGLVTITLNQGRIARHAVISPHGIAMLKAYILPLWFSLFSSFQRLIREIIERILTKLGHIFIFDCYLKHLVRTPRAFTPPPQTGGKNRTYLCNGI